MGWCGILAEPGKAWHPHLRKNRISQIDTRAVWRNSGCELLFNETELREISTLDKFNMCDLHSVLRLQGKEYLVKTISLEDLLQTHSVPNEIDYLSIDTEDSEYEILAHFDFGKRVLRCITCDHNYTANREKINSLLTSKGYVKKYTEFSECDDWYFLDRES